MGGLFFGGGPLEVTLDGPTPFVAKGDWVTLEGADLLFAGGGTPPPMVWGFLIPTSFTGAFEGGPTVVFFALALTGAEEGAFGPGILVNGAFAGATGIGRLTPTFAGGAGAVEGEPGVFGVGATAFFPGTLLTENGDRLVAAGILLAGAGGPVLGVGGPGDDGFFKLNFFYS